MAILNKIRSKGIFLIIVIAMALFAFILADVIQNGGFASAKSENTIATINGKDIGRIDFANRVQATQQNFGGQLSSVQAVNRVWDDMVKQTLLDEQINKLGIDVGNQQLISAIEDQFGANPEFFRDGRFDFNQFQAYIEQLKYDSPQAYQQWLVTEEALADQAKNDIYFDLIQAGLGVTSAEAKEIYKVNNTDFTIHYVKVPFTFIKDDEVEVTDAEINKYINDHREEFKTDGARDMRYVLFEEKATAEDEENIKNSLRALLNDHKVFNKAAGMEEDVKGFRNTTNYETYLNEYSELGFEDVFQYKQDVAKNVADTLFNLGKGAIYGPYKDAGFWKYTKIADTRQMPDSVSVRHILIGHNEGGMDIDRTREEAQQLADSIMSVITADISKFGEMAEEFSDDPTAKEGKADWLVRPKDTNEVIDFAFFNESGSAKVIEFPYGYIVTYIEDVRNIQKTVKLATLAQKIEPSEETLNKIFTEVTSFQIAAGEGDFAQEAEAKGYNVRTVNNLRPLDENISGIGSHRNIVQWAFEETTNPGSINRYEINQGHLVVQVTSKTTAGVQGIDAASAKVRPILMKQKKVAKIKERMSGENLDDIGGNFGTQMKTQSNVTFLEPNLEGNEQGVVAKAFGLKDGEISDPIEGKTGVYIIQVQRRTLPDDLGSYNGIIHQENEKILPKATDKIMEALKEKADIKDRRANFY